MWVDIALVVSQIVVPCAVGVGAKALEEQSKKMKAGRTDRPVRELVLEACQEGADAWFQQWESDIRLLADWIAGQANCIGAQAEGLRARITALDASLNELHSLSAFHPLERYPRRR